MALTDERKPYEILIRFGDDGVPQGAHVQYRRTVMLDGEILKDEPEPAEPLGLDDFPTSALLAETTRAALAEIARLNAVMEGLQAEVQIGAERIRALESTLAASGRRPGTG